MTKQLFGSVSSGTMNPDDLIPAFLDALRDLDSERADNIEAAFDDFDDDSAEHEQYILEQLFDALNEHSPDYGYFGAHPGDGADYGFWLVDDLNQSVIDDGGVVVDDLSEVPDDHSGIVLHVNDHGNATLYACDSGKLTEIWSVV